MSDKQYLEAVTSLLAETYAAIDTYTSLEIYHSVVEETERRLLALKAQEDNIKSDMWKEES